MNRDFIEKAKTADIMSLFDKHNIEYNQESGHIKILCPYHEEDTPSCAVYEDHYHCFSCSAHGDFIDLIKKLFDCDFYSAVTILNKLYEQ